MTRHRAGTADLIGSHTPRREASEQRIAAAVDAALEHVRAGDVEAASAVVSALRSRRFEEAAKKRILSALVDVDDPSRMDDDVRRLLVARGHVRTEHWERAWTCLDCGRRMRAVKFCGRWVLVGPTERAKDLTEGRCVV